MSANQIKLQSVINGGVPFTEVFRQVDVSNTITDAEGSEWEQITAMGYRRKCDKFFWPADPRNADNHLGKLAPTVAEVEKLRNTPLPPGGICVDMSTGKSIPMKAYAPPPTHVSTSAPGAADKYMRGAGSSAWLDDSAAHRAARHAREGI
jgi:hypothetical protein